MSPHDKSSSLPRSSFRTRWSAPVARDELESEIPLTVLDSKPCLVCGYDLKGLASAGICPECSSPVIRSLRGNLLRYASLPYLKTLRQGAIIIELSFAASVLLGVLGVVTAVVLVGFLGASGFGSIIFAMAVVAVVKFIGLVGWWMVSSPDPGPGIEDTGSSARKVLRFALIAAAAVALAKEGLVHVPSFAQFGSSTAISPNAGAISIILQMSGITIPVIWPPTWQELVWGAVGILGISLTITKLVASMLYLRSVVRRMPDPELEKHVKHFTWLGPLLDTVGKVFCGLGPLIAFIISWVIIARFRSRLGTIIDQHVDGTPAFGASAYTAEQAEDET